MHSIADSQHLCADEHGSCLERGQSETHKPVTRVRAGFPECLCLGMVE